MNTNLSQDPASFINGLQTGCQGVLMSNLENIYIYDGWNLIMEIQHSNIPPFQSSTNHFVWGRDLSGALQGAGGVGGLLAASRNGTWYFPLTDANGNITAYVDETGTLAAAYIYDAFGGTIAQTGTMADAFPHRFSTKYHDAETGLYYYGYRFYDPVLHRWLNRDPLGERGGILLYGFVKKHLFDAVDFLGLAEIHNNSKGTIVIIGSENFSYKASDSAGCCSTYKSEKISAIPLPLGAGQKALPGDPVQDPDAVIDIDGNPYKTGGTQKIEVVGDAPHSALTYKDIGGRLGSTGKKASSEFWAEPNIVVRCDGAINNLDALKKKVQDCNQDDANKAVLARIDVLIGLVKQAKIILETDYGIKASLPTPASPQPPALAPNAPSSPQEPM